LLLLIDRNPSAFLPKVYQNFLQSLSQFDDSHQNPQRRQHLVHLKNPEKAIKMKEKMQTS
jgi:hypothetical protein